MSGRMFNLDAYLLALALIATLGVLAWGVSLKLRDVSIVDSLWSLMFVLAAVAYSLSTSQPGPRAWLVLLLVAVWALRLSAYITWRNWGEGEDYRYQEIRKNNEPNFEVKSLFIVFGLQGLLASIVSLPLMAAINGQTALGVLDVLGVLLWAVGFLFEAGGDYQLARFRSNPANKGQVLDTGFWRYTRHPNYFGDFCIWWGFFVLALAAGGWWSVLSPLLMSVLLLKVSGVAMLEKTIKERRPRYSDYLQSTNAFFPGPRKALTNKTKPNQTTAAS
jgi:steroid 5-alpha reductase family enzyme